MKIAIGIFIHAEPGNLRETMAGLRVHTQLPYEVLLLPDGPDAPTRSVLDAYRSLRQLPADEPCGTPAAFNRLVSSTPADLYVLLESGAVAGPRWLELLIAGLRTDSRNGLAGPSTNRCWNAQAITAAAVGTTLGVRHSAQDAIRRFGNKVQTLGPLHSLADFCYAVRREVIDAIGLADEAYGIGPCWEMDYNIRAARAGWRAVWACGAFVYRAPLTHRRKLEEEQLFDASKRRYQDKFCGARLRGQKTDYRAHCRGDACPNFAPVEFAARWTEITGKGSGPEIIQTASLPAETLTPIESPPASAPLVSCVMPTCNRRPFVPAAIQSFLAQDYPNLELLVVDDGVDTIQDLLPADPRIRYLRLAKKKILGDKRNFACQQARGDFIVHWDDDDWYPPDRVTRQMAHLASAKVEVCGTSQLFYYDPPAERAWLYRYAGRGRSWVAGNTLAYRRAFWQRHPFPHLQIGEDTRFVWSDAQAKIHDLHDPTLCVARVHSANTSRKSTQGPCWKTWPINEIHRLLGESVANFIGPRSRHDPLPLISCIMPTANRRKFVQLALRSFRQQDYPHRELIVVDDGKENLSDLFGDSADVRYVRLPSRLTIGAKRNLACQAARGSIIAHWDDDDWYGPQRLSCQAAPLIQGEADITGLENRYSLDLVSGQFWNILPALHRRMFAGDVHGGTLVFHKAMFDQGLRYPPVNLAEDAALLRNALQKGKRLKRLPNSDLFVYVRHGTNAWAFTAGRFLDTAGWQRTEGPAAFKSSIADYQACLA